MHQGVVKIKLLKFLRYLEIMPFTFSNVGNLFSELLCFAAIGVNDFVTPFGAVTGFSRGGVKNSPNGLDRH